MINSPLFDNSALLDDQLEAGLNGDFEKGWKIAQRLILETPDCPRAAFNRGWYELQRGKLLEGHRSLDAGRQINVFGNRHIGTSKPIWYQRYGVTVLLNLEGGFGDQIHGARFATILAKKYKCRVILACSEGLEPILNDIVGVSAVISHDAALSAFYDFWLPSMSAVVALELEYEDLTGKSYIPRTRESEGKIGLRWVGNPEFEHQQHRLFPEDQFFDAVSGIDRRRLISLQKDVAVPLWLNQEPLASWAETQALISTCSLVISSCTSVAHLAAAMGVETWIIIPILPYYLWAEDGPRTRYYNSVTLFRQEEYGNWKAPFDKIKTRLN